MFWPARAEPLRALSAIAVLLASALALPSNAQTAPWVAETLDSDTVNTVLAYLDHKDCAGAARALDAGVKKGYPSVLMLAGGMFEDGVCLKANWPRALGFYERAHGAGHPRAAAKIAAGYAMPDAGPDKAAALWWALRARQALPPECSAATAALGDADAFVGQLKAWPAERLDSCVFVAAVVATVAADMRFSQRAADHGMRGRLTVNYQPSSDSVDIDTEALDFIQLGGVVSGELMRDRESRFVRLEFERDIRAVAARALARYTKPARIDPAWRVSMTFIFDYVQR